MKIYRPNSSPSRRLSLFCFALCLLVTLLPALAEDSAENLLQLGIAQIRLKKFEDARKPLEAAFAAAKNPRHKMSAAEAQMRVYRETANYEKYLDAADYVIAHSERQAARSICSSQVGAFTHFNGKTDDAIKRYESRLRENPNDIAAVHVLAEIYSRTDRENLAQAKTVIERRTVLDKEIATSHAKKLETEAEKEGNPAAWLLKDAAQFWIEAGQSKQALAAARKSLGATPENRSQILSYQYRDAIGDIFLQTGETGQAVKQFEAAAKLAPEGILKTNVEKKAEQAKALLSQSAKTEKAE